MAADLPGGSLTVFTDANGMYQFALDAAGNVLDSPRPSRAGFRDGAEENADPNAPPPSIGNDVF